MPNAFYDPRIDFTVQEDGEGEVYVSVAIGVHRPVNRDVIDRLQRVAAQVQAAAEEALRSSEGVGAQEEQRKQRRVPAPRF